MSVSAPSGWAEIVVARDDAEAQLIIGKLRDAGIEVEAIKTNTGPGAWLTGVQNQWTPVAILVPLESADEARRLLGIHQEPAGPPITEKGEPLVARTRAIWAIAIVLLAALLVSLLAGPIDQFFDS